jgi:hypothetical protein
MNCTLNAKPGLTGVEVMTFALEKNALKVTWKPGYGGHYLDL